MSGRSTWCYVCSLTRLKCAALPPWFESTLPSVRSDMAGTEKSPLLHGSSARAGLAGRHRNVGLVENPRQRKKHVNGEGRALFVVLIFTLFAIVGLLSVISSKAAEHGTVGVGDSIRKGSEQAGGGGEEGDGANAVLLRASTTAATEDGQKFVGEIQAGPNGDLGDHKVIVTNVGHELDAQSKGGVDSDGAAATARAHASQRGQAGRVSGENVRSVSSYRIYVVHS